MSRRVIYLAAVLLTLTFSSCSKGRREPQTRWEPVAAQKQCSQDLGTPVKIANSIDMELVLIPAGEFVMGSPESERDRDRSELQHPVRITEAFYAGIYEVTQAEYERVIGKNPSRFSPDGGGKKTVAGLKTDWFPVESVSREDAMEFCRKLSALPEEKAAGRGYRLLTEAEWEYACRAGATTPFHCGSQLNGRQANCDGSYPYGTTAKGPFLQRTTTVGSYTPNAFGLYDMHGNVCEWCSDWYDVQYYESSPESDPQGPPAATSGVIRGGCWLYEARYCRSAIRVGSVPTLRGNFLGFRVAFDPPGKSSKTAASGSET